MSSLISEEEVLSIIKKHDLEKYGDSFEETNCTPLKHLEIRDDDVFLIGYIKSGTTWLQELVWLIGNDLNYEGAKTFIDERFPVAELSLYGGSENYSKDVFTDVLECHVDSFNYIKNMKTRRFIKTHVSPHVLPTQLLSAEKKAKIIYISRNVKDVCTSFYHYSKNIMKCHNAMLDDYCKVFMGFKCTYWQSVLYFWNLRNEKNVLFVRYEDMKANLGNVIQKVAKFLDKTITEAQQEELTKWLHFDKMKANNAVNHNNIYKESGFIRTGKVGGYKEEMSPEIISLFDAWIKESLKDSDYVEYD